MLYETLKRDNVHGILGLGILGLGILGSDLGILGLGILGHSILGLGILGVLFRSFPNFLFAASLKHPTGSSNVGVWWKWVQ